MEKLIKIPSDSKFLKDKDISDLLFGYCSINSKKNEMGDYSLEYNNSNICSILNISYPTYVKKRRKLEKEGYIKIAENKIYMLCENYECSCKIPISIVRALVKSNINNIIKIFVVLNIFYETKGGGWFTYRSLLNQIGYCGENSTSGNKNMKEILDYLVNMNLLKYTVENSNDIRYRRFKILEIAKKISIEENEFEWKWKANNIDIETIKKNNKKIIKKKIYFIY